MKPKLSILICSLVQREKYLNRLKNILLPQIPKDGSVEVLVDLDAGERSIGEKRNNLLNNAKGFYQCSVDDDDCVAPFYIEKILEAIKTEPDVCSLHLSMLTDGQNPQDSYHSIKYTEWFDIPDTRKPGNKIYFRMPNHLNVCKTYLARQVGYKPISMGEDRDYSQRLLPLLKTEVEIPEILYTYEVRTFKEC